MSEPIESKAPKAFISYSHDSPAHKKWVAGLADNLMARGIDVVLDQWELGPGDDVPKFMERAVSTADCVLMICTEVYVRKADDGQGGVGYEAMIVTGELVKNLGTSKFVPVIRQENGGNQVPKSVSTRMYVNLSDGKDFDEGLTDLVHKIHKVPRIKKPSVGASPFPVAVVPATTASVLEVSVVDGTAMFTSGLSLAKANDLIGWRKLVQKTREPMSKALAAWQQKYNPMGPAAVADLPDRISEGATVYSPLISLAVAGAISGNPKFDNQAGILDELVSPANWIEAGMTYVAQIPASLVFTFQALHGAACVFSGQVLKAVLLSRARLKDPYSGQADYMYRQHQFMGWPESFGQRHDVAWHYLRELYKKWAWIRELFGSEGDYYAALYGYYLALHIQELADMFSHGDEPSLEKEKFFLVPIRGLRVGTHEAERAYRMVVSSPDEVREIWRSLGVSDARMASGWDIWLKQSYNKQGYVGTVDKRVPLPHAHLFDDIRPEAERS